MSAELLRFPQRALTTTELKYCRQKIGIPEPDRQQTLSFLGGGQQSLKSNPRMLRLMDAISIHTLESLGATNLTGRRLFTGGALLVSSVYLFVNGQTDLDVQDQALTNMEQNCVRDFILDGPDLLKQQASGVCQLLDRLMPALDPGDELKEIAYIGASAVHQVLLESEQAKPILPAQLAAYEVDESWQQLANLFKQELG